MPAKRHSKESIISTLQSLAADLGKTVLTTSDVQRVLPQSSVRNYFSSLRKAVEAAGLEMTDNQDHLDSVRRILSDDELFKSIQTVERKLGREPKAYEYIADGAYSSTPFKDRFGAKWSDTLAYYRKWKADHTAASLDVSITSDSDGAESPTNPPVPAARVNLRPQQLSSAVPIQFYGEPFDFRGLRHAPINEQGVVYLFRDGKP